ncbi:MAG: (Fe-S)-binding protein [Bacteroidales bacterium]|nr:(Fe-S)-binding protein [Bacteroidales bacterium]
MNSKNKLEGDHAKVFNVLERKVNAQLVTYLNSCVHCGLCSKSCHYYLTEPKASYSPSTKVDMIASIYRRYYTLSGKLFPALTGAREINDQTIEEMVDLAYGSCSMCGRCTMHCSVGIDIGLLVRTSRAMLAEIDLVPKGLDTTAHLAIKTGNNMGITKEDLIDTLEWLEDDLKMEVDDDNAAIPLDKKDALYAYTLNPREPKFFPLSISAMAKIFYAAKENWTISTKVYDVTNYSYFSGEEGDAQILAERYRDELIALNSGKLVLGECGHGYRAFRWEGPDWMREQYPVDAESVLQIMAEYIKNGTIKADPALNTKRVTLHDPCNLVRNGGIIEEQRYILKHCVSDFVEMTPNRTDNYCCGGGGGQLAMGDYAERRIKVGKIKADQIRATGAKIVATPCHNCIDQLMELNHKYKLGVEIKTIGEILADALVLEPRSDKE